MLHIHIVSYLKYLLRIGQVFQNIQLLNYINRLENYYTIQSINYDTLINSFIIFSFRFGFFFLSISRIFYCILNIQSHNFRRQFYWKLNNRCVAQFRHNQDHLHLCVRYAHNFLINLQCLLLFRHRFSIDCCYTKRSEYRTVDLNGRL